MLHDQTDLPTGSVTFVFTDIEGSTVRWERAPTQMREALNRHDTIMREALGQCGGVLFQTAGDSFVVAFASAPDALEMALSAQRALRAETWPPEIGSLRVRMALHTGTVTRTEHGYEANHALTRQSRFLATAHADQILVSGITRELLIGQLPEGVELRDLGELHLKNLVEPQRAFQVVASAPPWSLPDDFAPPLGQQERPGNLPISPLPFIGRGLAVDELAHAVTEGSQRLTTLLGPGGIGKTRLAIRIAERVQHHFADGAFFVDLAAITDVELVVPAIGSTLGLPDTDARSLADYLSSRELLLVLDNLEQVIDSAVEIATLMAAAPSLRIVVTSRSPLHVLGEFEYPVAALELPDPSAPVDDIDSFAESEAMALFVQRAKAVRRDFALTSDNVRCAALICQRLEGIPLALLLAASRLKIMSLEEMLERLGHRLAELTDGARDLPARHQTLRDTIEWSHDLLDSEQRLRYEQWSVFAGWFGSDAARALDPVADGSGTADGLRSLVDCSLLVIEQRADGEARYRMLETINEHGREKLESGGRAEHARRAHTRHFLSLAEEASQHLEVGEVALWSSRLEADHDNLRAVLAREFRRADEGDEASAAIAVRTATALATFWLERNHHAEGRSHLESALALVPVWAEAAAGERERTQARSSAGVLYDNLGCMARRQGAMREARQMTERAISIYRSLDDGRGEGRVLATMGSLLLKEGDVEGSRAAHVRSIELARSSRDDVTVVNGLLSLGNVERDTGDHGAARELYEEALAVAGRIREVIGQSVALNNLANLAIAAGEWDRARRLHLESLVLRHDVGYRIMVAESMVGLAMIDVAAGERTRAAKLLGFAVALAEEVGATFDPEEQRLYDRAVQALRADAEATWLAEAEQVGRSMTLEASMTLAKGQ